MIYKTLVLTGLRKGELASLTIGQLVLEPANGVAYAVLKSEHSKNAQESEIPLRGDLVTDIKNWLAKRLAFQQAQALRRRQPVPSRISADAKLFHIPADLIRVFDRDLLAAGLAKRVMRNGKWVIDKRDDRGRTVDIHALRHTFGTHLSRGGVSPRVAQSAMRHSRIDLTMNTYTDPRLLDVASAIKVLPALPLGETQPKTSNSPAVDRAS